MASKKWKGITKGVGIFGLGALTGGYISGVLDRNKIRAVKNEEIQKLAILGRQSLLEQSAIGRLREISKPEVIPLSEQPVKNQAGIAMPPMSIIVIIIAVVVILGLGVLRK